MVSILEYERKSIDSVVSIIKGIFLVFMVLTTDFLPPALYGVVIVMTYR